MHVFKQAYEKEIAADEIFFLHINNKIQTNKDTTNFIFTRKYIGFFL